MKVTIDPELCEGYGNCAAHLPAVFVLDDDGYASVAGDGEIAAGDEDAAQRAILDCPVHAIAQGS